MTPDPYDLRALAPQARDLTLAALRGWTCRWPCPPDGPRLVMPTKPYQPPQAGRAPGRAYETTDRYGHILGTDRHYTDWPPKDPSLEPGRGGGRLL